MSQPANGPTGDTARRRMRPVVVAAGVALVVGLLLGGLVGALVADSGDGGAAGEQAAPTTGSAAPTAAPGNVEVRIDEACLLAIDAARQAYETLGGAGQALADLDAARLDAVIDRLLPLEQQLREGSDECDVAARRSGGSAESEPPPAPASPSASPGG